MKALFKYLKLGGIFLGLILFVAFILGLLNLFGVSYKATSFFSIIIMAILFLIFGILEGMNTLKKGFIAGFKIGLYLLSFIFIINIILFRTSFGISRVIYYVVLLFSAVFGSMIGINKKKKN